MRFLVVLLGVALAAAGPYYSVDTRPECPPEGYTALSPNSRLDRLPSGGKYALCRTSGQSDTESDATWTMSHGVFRLRDSQLFVDRTLQVEFQYPAHPDWSDVVVDGDMWAGVTIRGAPAEDLLTATHQPHWPTPFGDCGDFDTVLFENTEPGATTLMLDYCRQPTTLKKVTIFVLGGVGLEMENSKEIVVQDLFVAGDDFTGSRRRGGIPFDAAKITNSQVGFIAPIMYDRGSQFTVFELSEGSAVTLCNPFMARGLSIDQVVHIDGSDSGTSLTVAGVTNLVFPNSADYDGDALVIILPTCPDVMRDSYDMRLWSAYYTQRETLGYVG